MLFRKCQLSEASHRYKYALKKIPAYKDKNIADQFRQIQVHLLLNLSRTERRLGNCHEAVQVASEALILSPENVEGYLARGKANQAAGKLKDALCDFCQALDMNPASREIRKAILKLREEIGSENSQILRMSARFASAESLTNRSFQDFDSISKYSSKS